jgi:hypothetical protein
MGRSGIDERRNAVSDYSIPLGRSARIALTVDRDKWLALNLAKILRGQPHKIGVEFPTGGREAGRLTGRKQSERRAFPQACG